MKHQMKISLLLLGLLITSCISPVMEGDSEINSLLEAYTTTWNTHDGEAVAAYYTSDADLIMGSLPLITGRKAIGRWWNTYFSQIAESRKGEFKLLTIRDIAPDVRIVNVCSKTYGRNKDSKELETRLARGTWVLVKRNDIWQIASMRGLPAEGEQRYRPGVDR
jgi:uncharacterized protein (TIGR02246 family)